MYLKLANWIGVKTSVLMVAALKYVLGLRFVEHH
jgi:hypothetical protein